ncbi:unnamed protein product [Citrullus colocynthis]|uniref:Uncharacterized protein n=1 Tax=Citrullus colocynthis TaxID=252529 RepID=A0ABP0YQN9_9ROSI
MTWQKIFEIPPKPELSIDIAISLSLSLFNETDSLHIPLATLFPSKGSPHSTQSQSQNASHGPNQTKRNFSSHFTLTLSFLIFFPNPRVLQDSS